MTIEDRVKKALEEQEEKREGTESFKNLRDFYAHMKDGGFVIQQEYTLPPVDTVGRTSCSVESARKKRQ